MSAVALMIVSCGAPKSASNPESRIYTAQSLEGEKVIVEDSEDCGKEEADAFNEDGTKIIKRPYIWFGAYGKANDKQVAIEMARREAYAQISRVINNMVKDDSERGNVINNGNVQQAVTQHWVQFSQSLQRGCEPFGKLRIEYNPATHMYNAKAKVGIRADRFYKMINDAASYVPSDLKGEELDKFMETNKKIMEAAKAKFDK